MNVHLAESKIVGGMDMDFALLVAEDNEDEAALLQLALKKAGFIRGTYLEKRGLTLR